MAVPSDYRWVSVGKLVMRNRKDSPHYAPTFSLQDLISALEDRKNKGLAFRGYAKNTRGMWCHHIDNDNDFHQIILETGDKNVAGVSYYDFSTGNSRDIKKKEDEGGHYTSHVMIKKNPDSFGRHLILVEKVPGIYFSSVKDHFSWVMRDTCYQKVAKDDDGADHSFRAYFEVDGYRSRTIRDALKGGVLQDIEFVSSQKTYPDGLDEDGIIDDMILESRWEIKKRVDEGVAEKIFKAVPNWAKKIAGSEECSEVFVRIKAENGQIKKTEVQISDGEILEQAFIQNEIVGNFENDLPQRYSGFRSDMLKKMKKITESLPE
jgi:hypothetical protein